MTSMLSFILSLFTEIILTSSAWSFSTCHCFLAESSPQKVKLTDIQTLTLRADHMTNGLRNSPVPQLTCIGGTAANLFKPQVVQCYNHGSDGDDVQWECETDMDNAYRFGIIKVMCEGYDYPDDKYTLMGSCMLEYTLDLTKEDFAQQRQGRQDNHGVNSHSENGHRKTPSDHKKKAGTGDFIAVLILGVIMYAIYKTFLRMPRRNHDSTGYGYRKSPPAYSDHHAFGGTGSCTSCSNGSSSTGSRSAY